MSRAYQLFIVLALLAACERPGDSDRTRVAAGRALSGTLAYPRSTPVTVAAGEEAAQLTMTSQDSLPVIVAWFRRALPLNGWVILREATGPAGDVTLYAQKGDRPLWITLRANVGAVGTTYTMIGEIPADSTKR
ncbi:MAG: hypothetical protein DMD54_00910 [Gemmatimonadetes bacterium]|nr:MAG: hypothetical protein DMD54_00910 [Gemmatimonadota bacterium]